MDALRQSKQEQLQIFERRSAKRRQSLEEKQRHLEQRERRLQEERQQLEQEWERHNEYYESGQKFINELWAEPDESDDGEPEPRLEEAQDEPTLQQENSPSANGSSGHSINDAVLVIVENWQDDLAITQSEVTPEFLRKHPERRSKSLVSSISHSLSQLAKGEDRILDLVEKGSGSRPAKYRKRVRTEDMEP